jgi:transposase
MKTLLSKILLTNGYKQELEKRERSRILPQKVVLRAKIILMASEGKSNSVIAKTLNVSRPTVIHWRTNFVKSGLDGLEDVQKPGRPPVIPENTIKDIISFAMVKPENATHWSTRTMAKEKKVSHMTVQRIWKKVHLQPHRTETFKYSTDPDLIPKTIDIIGLYLNPPDNALVLSADEKSQIQALDRTQPLLPLRPGQVERHTHDYVRHGTTCLFAALEIASGKVIAECHPRHRHNEFLKFLKLIDKQTPLEKDIHLIIDNYSTHKHQKVKNWLKRHSRIHFHFTPTGSSWLNQIETWFSILTNKRIRRGIFKSVKELIDAIKHYIEVNNSNPKPFVWTKTANEIISKLQYCKDTYVTGH